MILKKQTKSIRDLRHEENVTAELDKHTAMIELLAMLSGVDLSEDETSTTTEGETEDE